MRTITSLFTGFFLSLSVVFFAQGPYPDTLRLPLQPGEKIWSGAIKEGHKMPFTAGYSFDFYANNNYNQLQPLLLSNKGLYVWSEMPYAFSISANELILFCRKQEMKSGHAGKSISDAYRSASANYFPASGKMPDELLFERPQYNTWIELTYNHNQADILKYARAIAANGFPTGVFMIDDTWQEDYGLWRFHPGRFPQPKQMMDELHAMGFKVMVWICPFVSADQCLLEQELMRKRAFLLDNRSGKETWESATDPAIIKWWNGYSAELDFTNPEAVNWFQKQLDRITADYGVDGFKFDAGDMDFYPPWALSREPASPNRQSELWAQFGLNYPLNEYRACWKMAGKPLTQRLHDKNHNWEDLQKLIPHMMTEALAGYTFSCPDMIGGGDWTSFLNPDLLDQDLVVRSAQTHALMPMMQFSVAPWRILDTEHLQAVKDAIAVRTKYTPQILERAKKSAATGEPIVAPMEYYYPGQGFEEVKDQFLLGERILVAPLLEKKTNTRTVQLPKGKWKADDGIVYKGGKSYVLTVPLNRLPVFERMDQ